MEKESIQIGGTHCVVYKSRQFTDLGEDHQGSTAEPVFFLLQPVDDHDLEGMDREAELVEKSSGAPFLLAACKVEDWNKDLTPWAAPPVWGKEPFGDGAEKTLSFLSEQVVPYLKEKYHLPEYLSNRASIADHSKAEERAAEDSSIESSPESPSIGISRTGASGAEELKAGAAPALKIILGGYSLAGFFSLWAAYETGIFSAVTAASPSVWYPGWMDYAKGHVPQADAVYLSLGKKEEKTKNKVMAAVGDCIRSQHDILDGQGIPNTLEWNEGNHFVHPEERTAKGFAWCMQQLSSEKRSK